MKKIKTSLFVLCMGLGISLSTQAFPRCDMLKISCMNGNQEACSLYCGPQCPLDIRFCR